jgi:hypothetical protein
MPNQKTIPASQQVQNLRDQLLQALIQKEDASLALKGAEERITAIRNVLAGVGVGSELEQEKQAAQAPAPTE